MSYNLSSREDHEPSQIPRIISLFSEEFHQIAQAGLKLEIFCWDYEYMVSLPAHGDMVKRTATCEPPNPKRKLELTRLWEV